MNFNNWNINSDCKKYSESIGDNKNVEILTNYEIEGVKVKRRFPTVYGKLSHVSPCIWCDIVVEDTELTKVYYWHFSIGLEIKPLKGAKVAIDMKLNLMIHSRYGYQSIQLDKLNKWYHYNKALSSIIWTLEGEEFTLLYSIWKI